MQVPNQKQTGILAGRRTFLAQVAPNNKQIAADNHLSVRWVEGRLQHVYGKLEISIHRELGVAVRDHADS